MSRYYDSSLLLSRNSLFNAIISARSDGKTYDFKKKCIKRFLKKGEQFIYVRRFKTELKKIDKFFDDIKIEFPDYDFKVDSGNFYIKKNDVKKWNKNHICGGYLCLSTQLTVKSVSYPKVTWIGFDEFIISTKGYYRYLEDEVTSFLELYSTIARLRDVKVMFMANSISSINPYFLYFNIKLEKNKRFITKNDFTVEYHVPEEHKEAVKKTRFGKMISGTDYGKYAIDNEFAEDIVDFIEKIPKNSECRFTIYYKGKHYGVFYNYTYGNIYISNKYNSNSKFIYVLRVEDIRDGYLMVHKPKDNPYFKHLSNCFKENRVRFENLYIKDIMFEIFRKIIF